MKELSIEITLDENGMLEAETFGFKGKICDTELRALLSDEFVIEEIEHTDDYYKAEEEEVLRSLRASRRGQ